MFHGNPALSGALSGTPPQRATVQWSSNFPATNPRANDPPYEASPVVTSGVVYTTLDNVLYAINASTGTTMSSAYLPGGPGSGPAVGTPLLLSGNLLSVPQDGGPNNQWFQPLPTGAGVSCPLGGNPASGSPTVTQGSVFQADTSGNVWRVTLGTLLGCPAAPWAAPGGAAYFSTPALGYAQKVPTLYLPDSGTRTLDAFQGVGASTATSPAGFPVTFLGCQLRSSLSLQNMTNGTSVAPVGFLGDDCGGGAVSHLFAVNLSSGKILSTLNLPPPVAGGSSGVWVTPALGLSGPAPSTEEVYFSSQNGNLSAAYFSTSPSGGNWSWSWNFTGKGAFFASPVVWGNEVLDGDSSGWLYAVNALTGALDWEVNLGSPLYSSPALSPPDVFESTAAGTTVEIAPAAPPLSLQLPSTVSPGTMVPVQATLTALNASGVPSGGLAGATVDLTATAGTLTSASAVTNASGVALFDWTAPSGASTSLTVLFAANSTPVGYGPASAQSSTLVPAGSGGGSSSLTVAISASTHTVVAGQTQPVQVSVSRLGIASSGAAVTLTVSPSLGSVSPTSAVAGSSGNVQFNYTAPTSLTATTAVLLVATAVLGNSSGTSDAPFALLPAGSVSGALTVSWTSTGTTFDTGTSHSVSVTVLNATTASPVPNASVSFSVVTSGGGTVSPASVTTGSKGSASTIFHAGAYGSPSVVELLASAQLGSAQGTAPLAVVVDPLPLSLSWILPTGGLTGGRSAQVGVLATSNGSVVGPGFSVAVALSGAGQLNASSVATDGSGVAWFTVTITSGTTSSLLFFASAGGGSGPYGAAISTLNAPVGKASSGNTASSSPPYYLWLAAALAVIGLVALAIALLVAGKRRGGKAEEPAPASKDFVEEKKEAPSSSPEPKAGPASPKPAPKADPVEPAKPSSPPSEAAPPKEPAAEWAEG